ncbi:MAG: hypothetical protein MJZ32_05210 [Bacteroidaceae bacterium]|nr:hypothetical protein [Bacteroidaceae bacterium]
MIAILVFWALHFAICIILFHADEFGCNRPEWIQNIDQYLDEHQKLEFVLYRHFFPLMLVYAVFYYPIDMILYGIISYIREKWFPRKTPEIRIGERKRPESLDKMVIDTSRSINVLVSTDINYVSDGNQILYIENEYDEEVNKFIQDNIVEIRFACHSKQYEFVYIPLDAKRIFTKEKIRYACPWATEDQIEQLVPQNSNWIMKYVNTMKKPMVYQYDEEKGIFYNCAPPAEFIPPGFIASKRFTHGDEERGFYHVYSHYPVRPDEINDVRQWMKELLRDAFRSGVLNKTKDDPEEDDADSTFFNQSREIMDEIRQKVEQLRSLGISEAIIKDLFMPKQELSRMLITKDYRIFLPDYNNMEIKLTALPKAVYFLFLRHPEGIMFKELSDYRHELASIYNKLTNRSDNEAVRQSIDDITNPLKNSINEKCARIREAFVGKFSESIAQNYIVIGYRGEPKKITLDRSLVTWEKEMEK